MVSGPLHSDGPEIHRRDNGTAICRPRRHQPAGAARRLKTSDSADLFPLNGLRPDGEYRTVSQEARPRLRCHLHGTGSGSARAATSHCQHDSREMGAPSKLSSRSQLYGQTV